MAGVGQHFLPGVGGNFNRPAGGFRGDQTAAGGDQQPVRADVALEIARLRPTLLAHLDDAAFQRGLDDLAAQGDALLPSEVAVVEVWAQKEG